MTKRFSLCVLLGLFGCNQDMMMEDADGAGSPGPAPDAMVSQKKKPLSSGSRLKVKMVAGEDGSEVRTGFYDTKLGVDCAFAEAEDGRLRCLPVEVASRQAPMATTLITDVEMFLDAACTQYAAVSSLCTAPKRFVRFTDTCGGRPRIASITEQPGARFWYKFQGVCSYFDNSLARYRIYSIGAPVSPSEFVAGNPSME